ncbi:MAG: hypothetical protein Q9216_002299 [Gyalolechia sp. 2 TL-2023]
MSLVELGRGNGLMASAHLREATELLMARSENEQADTSAEVASWGILTLATTWSALVYQKPTTPISSHALVFRDVPIERAGPLSQGGRRRSQSDSCTVRPAHYLRTAYEQAELYRIVHEILLSYCGSRGKVSGSDIVLIYERLLGWKKDLPTETPNAGAEDEGSNPGLFLLIQYHVTIIHTLQPMLYTKNIDQTSENYLTRAIVRHAQIAFKILVQYRDNYGIYHQSPIQLFCIIHVCDALVRYSPNDRSISEVVEYALQSLEGASVGYPVAKILRDSFSQVVLERLPELPMKIAQQLDQKSSYLPRDIHNVFTRSTYQQPIAQLLPVMDDSIGRDFVALLEKRHGSDWDAMQTNRGKLDSMQIKAVLNQQDPD